MPNQIDHLFKAIADPTRREIFHVLVLASTALPISKVAQEFNISRQGVTKHIKLLENAGLVDIGSKGREKFCYVNPAPLKMIIDWVAEYDKFWDNSLSKLDSYLKSKK